MRCFSSCCRDIFLCLDHHNPQLTIFSGHAILVLDAGCNILMWPKRSLLLGYHHGILPMTNQWLRMSTNIFMIRMIAYGKKFWKSWTPNKQGTSHNFQNSVFHVLLVAPSGWRNRSLSISIRSLNAASETCPMSPPFFFPIGFFCHLCPIFCPLCRVNWNILRWWLYG